MFGPFVKCPIVVRGGSGEPLEGGIRFASTAKAVDLETITNICVYLRSSAAKPFEGVN